MIYVFPIITLLFVEVVIAFAIYDLAKNYTEGKKEAIKRMEDDLHIEFSSSHTVEGRMQQLYVLHVKKFNQQYAHGELDFKFTNYILPLNFERVIMGLPENSTFEQKEERKKQFGEEKCNELALDAATQCVKALYKYFDTIKDCSYTLEKGDYIIHINRETNEKNIKESIRLWEPKEC